MNTSAIVLMVVTQVVVTAFTIHFFRKVLRSPKRAEPDSYDENDDQEL